MIPFDPNDAPDGFVAVLEGEYACRDKDLRRCTFLYLDADGAQCIGDHSAVCMSHRRSDRREVVFMPKGGTA